MAGSPSPSFDLSLLDGNVASQMAQVNKQKMLAQMLLKNSDQPQGTQAINGVAISQSPLGNIASALNQGLGAYQLSEATEGEVKLNQSRANALNNFTNGIIGGGNSQSPAPQQATGSVTNSATSPNERTVYAAPLDANTSSEQAQNDITGYRQQLDAAQQAQQAQPQGMRGSPLSPEAQRLARMAMLLNPSDATMKLLENQLPTGEQKDATFAAGGNQQAAANLLLGKLRQSGLQNVAAGGTVFDAATGKPTFSAPQDGSQMVYDDNGRAFAMPVQGAAANSQMMAAAEQYGKAQATPTQVYNPATQGMEYTSQAAVLGQGNGSSGAGGNGGMQAAPSLGAPEYAKTQGEAAGKRANEIVQLATDSPARVNVLQNIIDYSSKVTTGTGTEYFNKLRATPGFETLLGNASDYQTLAKYLQQNGLRSWQAAGGTGTDTQLTAAFNANPNTTQTPETIQRLAQYAIAGEKAVQGKANAMQNFMSNPQNNSPQAQQQFEAQWRNTVDPRVYQMQSMQPQEARDYFSKLSKQEQTELFNKRAALQQMGGL